MNSPEHYDRYYLTYSGISLPLQLVTPMEKADTENRNTYFGALYDDQERTTLIHKVVYGEVELEHRYGYHDNGTLQWAEIRDYDDEVQRLEFDTNGQRI